MVTSRPLANTCAAASGSTQTLNSADGVWFPSAIAPPMSTIRSSRAAASGCRVEKERNVRERAGRDERHRRLGGEDPLGEKVGRRRRHGLGHGRGEVGAVEPGLAVRFLRGGEVAGEGPVGACRHGDVAAPAELEHPDRVRGHLRQSLVPGHGGDPDEVELRAGEREEERDRVVLTRVAVDQDRDHGASTSTPAPVSALARSASIVRAVATDSSRVGTGAASPRAAAAKPSSSRR